MRDAVADKEPQEAAADPDAWRFRATTYGWLMSVSGNGLKLSATTSTALTYSMTIVEAGGLYEVAHWPGSPGSFTAIDALLGFRY